MKKFNYSMIVSLLLAFVFCATSCSKDKDDDADSSKAIVGIWDATKTQIYIDGKTLIEYFNMVDANGDGIADEFDEEGFADFYSKNKSYFYIQDEDNEDYVEFKANGYGAFIDDVDEIFNFKYEISNNKIYFTYIDENGEEDEYVDEYDFSIKSKTFTLTSEHEWESDGDGKKHTVRYITTYTKR